MAATTEPARRAADRRLPADERIRDVALAGAGGVVLAVVSHATGGRIGLPCPLHLLTGLDCPICGSTRMVGAVLHGDLAGALRLNAPVLLALAVVGYVELAWVVERLTGVHLPRPRLSARGRTWLQIAAIGAAVVFGIVRNLPFAPFTALRV